MVPKDMVDLSVLTVGLIDAKGVLQPQQFHDSLFLSVSIDFTES